jgi:hypothetical protein
MFTAMAAVALLTAAPTVPRALIAVDEQQAADCACASNLPAPRDQLRSCPSVGGQNFTTEQPLRAEKFDFAGSGVFQIVKAEGPCACSRHDDVEVQSFMCGTKAWDKGKSTNAAVAVRVQDMVLTISSADDNLVVSGTEDMTLKPVDHGAKFEFPTNGQGPKTIVARELLTYKKQSKFAWRITFPNGGYVLSLHWPVAALKTGALLHLWTSLPKNVFLGGLCASTCSDPPAEACGAHEVGIEYDSESLGQCETTSSAWDCSHKCWQSNHGKDVFFTFDTFEKECCCKGSSSGSGFGLLPRFVHSSVSGRACKKPCGASKECVHTKAAHSLFSTAMRKSLEGACGIKESIRPDEEPNCMPSQNLRAGKSVACGTGNAMKFKTWTQQSWFRIMSHASKEWNRGKCMSWCENAVTLPTDHVFGNSGPKYSTASVCNLRKSLLDGQKIRCGWDKKADKCNLFVGDNLKVQGKAGKLYRSMAKNCVVHTENITECAPEVEDVCQGTSIALEDAQDECKDQKDPAEFERCVMDFCAADEADEQAQETVITVAKVVENATAKEDAAVKEDADFVTQERAANGGFVTVMARNATTVAQISNVTSTATFTDDITEQIRSAMGRGPSSSLNVSLAADSTEEASTKELAATPTEGGQMQEQVGTERVVNSSLSLGGSCLAWCLTAPFKHGMTWSHRCHDHECQGCDSCKPEPWASTAASLALAATPLHENGTGATEQSAAASTEAEPHTMDAAPGEEPAAAHNDAQFVVNGKHKFFWLPTGHSTRLLEWESRDGGLRRARHRPRHLVLSGETFGKGSSQWFGTYTLLAEGKEAVTVSIADGAHVHGKDADATNHVHPLRTVRVWVDGVPMKGTDEAMKSKLAPGVTATASAAKRRLIGSAFAERVEITAPGMQLVIESSKAKKYDGEAAKVRWAHLDMNVHGPLPRDAKGLVAELAGLRPLSQQSKSYLSVPRSVYRERHSRTQSPKRKTRGGEHEGGRDKEKRP